MASAWCFIFVSRPQIEIHKIHLSSFTLNIQAIHLSTFTQFISQAFNVVDIMCAACPEGSYHNKTTGTCLGCPISAGGGAVLLYVVRTLHFASKKD